MTTSDVLPRPHTRVSRVRRAAAAAALALCLAPGLSAQGFCEQDGLLVFEIESTAPTGDWALETSSSGHTGSGYFRWAGPDQFNNPGQGVIAYTFTITNPGVYNFHIRNRHNDPDATMENDCWSRLDGGSWEKTYSKQAQTWTWSTWFELPGTDPEATLNLSAGTHTLELSGRSNNFRIDRVHLYLDGTPNPLDFQSPESPTGNCDAGWVDVGGGLAGTGGLTPTFTGDGPLTVGSPTTLSIADAVPDGQAHLILGASDVNLPFKGGVMIPSVDFLISGLPISASGTLVLPFNWPMNIPSGITIWWQTWVRDDNAPVGFSATNGLTCTTP